MSKSEKTGIKAHLKSPESFQAETFTAAQRLHALMFSIAQWTLFYHQHDREFCQTYKELTTGADYLAAELEYRIDRKKAVVAMEKEDVI